MQTRNGNSQSRLVLIGCMLLLLITGVLYFMKRLEASRLSVELSATKSEKKEREEDLNVKLTNYLQKMEEMTKQLGDLQNKLKLCEDAKAEQMLEAHSAKQAVSECHSQQAQHIQKQGQMEDDLDELQEKYENAKRDSLEQASQLQQSQKETESELESCQAMATNCQNSLARAQAESVQVKAKCEENLRQVQLQQRQPAPQQVAYNPSLNANRGFPNSDTQGVVYRPKLNVPSVPVQQFPSEQDSLSQADENENKEPYYPEEDDDEDKEGFPLDARRGVVNDQGFPLDPRRAMANRQSFQMNKPGDLPDAKDLFEQEEDKRDEYEQEEDQRLREEDGLGWNN